MLFASLCCLSVVYGLYGLISGQQANLSNGVSAFYNAAHRIVFVIGISCIVFLCANRYAGFRVSFGNPRNYFRTFFILMMHPNSFSTAPVRGILGWSGFVPLSRLTYGTYLLHPIVIMFIVMGSQNPSMLDDLSIVSFMF
ncbi:hypothetical protein FBUS_09416 [Fasciolopsis buskii]|uniref:Acyltransferase 3 domain-containing protein n=1 Tax=Fasciolopsis buskii TaxID=27845 RepID=A0A8E0VGI9_9TREM|nr:hypothetical protein FBUS_09416 [Fasciolopsis buski]